MNDIGNNGEKISIGQCGTISKEETNSYSRLDSMLFEAYVLNIDENYYKYIKSLNNYETGNPFAEATLVYSNITGGLGVFGAYTKNMKSIHVKN